MISENSALILTAISVGFFHTILGVDHYLPFIALAKANRWSVFKTGIVTTLCGTVHILSSVILGLLGIVLSLKLRSLMIFESFRNELTAWLLIGFGIVYLVWALRKLIRERFEQTTLQKSNNLFWLLFIVFVLGPCEPLIPLVMYPAAAKSAVLLLTVTLSFGLVTVLTMLSIVLVSLYGFINLVPSRFLEKYGHAFAGATLCACGLFSLLVH